MRSLHWFRADLRISDNTALTYAIEKSDELLAVFIITPLTWQQHDAAPIKIQFILNNLIRLSDQLAQHGIPLLIRTAKSFSDCPELLKKLCHEYKIDALYFNKQYEWDESQRDIGVIKQLQKQNIKVYQYDDQCVMPPGSVLSRESAPLKIFTPFKKVWLNRVMAENNWIPTPTSRKKFINTLQPDKIPMELKGFTNEQDLSPWPAGEKSAQQRLSQFCHNKVNQYHIDRDFPALDHTSKLSPYLAQGIISPRQCMQALFKNQHHNFSAIESNSGAGIWLSELIWREFYKHIMYYFPAVCRYKPFQTKTENLPWSYNQEHFNAWRNGVTGFPLVDAAMRQLKQTGWMHNRLRMVTAMFLSKTLFLDWRWGERYFMQNLIDGDLAANNGGWQWSASTGTDAVPYFRIFNPITQSKRFDPEGKFIKQYCPELMHLNSENIHNPYQVKIKIEKLNYPLPIVDYSVMRKKVIAIFKKLKG